MAEHLSDLALDELASGGRTVDASTAHLETCERCRRRLETIRRANDDARRAPRFETTFARLETARRHRRRLLWPLFAAVPIAAAAVLALVLLPTAQMPTARLKGTATVEVLRASTGEPLVAASPGEQVILSVGAAGLPFGMVLAVDEKGEVEALWPRDSTQSARVPAGAAVKLAPAFEVTAGSMTLIALFSDEPLEIAPRLEALRDAAARARQAGRDPLDVELPKTRGRDAVARTVLRVEPAR